MPPQTFLPSPPGLVRSLQVLKQRSLKYTCGGGFLSCQYFVPPGEAEHDDAGLAVSSFNAPLPFDDGEAVAVLLSMLLMVYFLLQASPLLAVHTLSEARGGLRHLLFLRRLAGGAYLASTVSGAP